MGLATHHGVKYMYGEREGEEGGREERRGGEKGRGGRKRWKGRRGEGKGRRREKERERERAEEEEEEKAKLAWYQILHVGRENKRKRGVEEVNIMCSITKMY